MNTTADSSPPQPTGRRAFLGCEILYREACRLAAECPHIVDVSFLEKGLHDLETPDMVARLQQAIDELDASGRYEAILLGYARCNDGLVGVRARSRPLVLPRAHDCITLFFGSRGAFQAYFDEHPGTYFMTTGWSERNVGREFAPGAGASHPGVMKNLGLDEPYEVLVEKYGRDNADFILQTVGHWRDNYSRMLYLKMGVCDEPPHIDRARARAAESGWEFACRDGDWALLQKLFTGPWDNDFLVVRPGQEIVARNNERIVDVE